MKQVPVGVSASSLSVGSPKDDELAGRSQMSLAGAFSSAYLWDNSPAHTDLA